MCCVEKSENTRTRASEPSPSRETQVKIAEDIQDAPGARAALLARRQRAFQREGER